MWQSYALVLAADKSGRSSVPDAVIVAAGGALASARSVPLWMPVAKFLQVVAARPDCVARVGAPPILRSLLSGLVCADSRGVRRACAAALHRVGADERAETQEAGPLAIDAHVLLIAALAGVHGAGPDAAGALAAMAARSPVARRALLDADCPAALVRSLAHCCPASNAEAHVDSEFFTFATRALVLTPQWRRWRGRDRESLSTCAQSWK